MGAGPSGWTIEFRGCEAAQDDCDIARFEVTPPHGTRSSIEVRTTAQIEQILARELGKETLDARDREALFAVAGRHMIEDRLAETGGVEPLLLLDSRLFHVPNAERRLLQECGLLPV